MFEVTVPTKKSVKYLLANCGVRYWEDGKVNGVEDSDDDPKMPLKDGDGWVIQIDLETGVIADWPKGITAETHYKVCDAGIYSLLDADEKVVVEFHGYVPSMMCPDGYGSGNYVIMKIDENGKIPNWKADLSCFENEQ